MGVVRSDLHDLIESFRLPCAGMDFRRAGVEGDQEMTEVNQVRKDGIRVKVMSVHLLFFLKVKHLLINRRRSMTL